MPMPAMPTPIRSSVTTESTLIQINLIFAFRQVKNAGSPFGKLSALPGFFHLRWSKTGSILGLKGESHLILTKNGAK
jgi:hypothetical protein